VTRIEWTDATWNPVVGCSRVSEGCRNCYAERMAGRIANAGQAATLRGQPIGEARAAYAEVVKARATMRGPHAIESPTYLGQWNGDVRLLESALAEPLRWRKPRRVFVNSMGDLFHHRVPDEWIDMVLAVVAATPQNTYQVLTKRPGRMAEYLAGYIGGRFATIEGATAARAVLPPALEARALRSRWPLPNLWVGTSVEDQTTADGRLPHLLAAPAALRFVSCEPLLGPVSLWRGDSARALLNLGPVANGRGLGWVIVGGESGPGARPMRPAWVRDLRDRCVVAGVPFFFKQWGGVRKAKAGAVLDGREWRQWPEAVAT
jgi:protein gp37